MSKTSAKGGSEKKVIRCAIYTRKSTEEGLQQEFNTLDAQRESGEAYIAAQKHEGWVCLPDKYDDGGFSGGNLERPAVRRLMKDIEAGKVDCVVVYKVDRLSRSLMDFSRVMQTFDRHKVSFVSVTQQFNTTHVTRARVTQVMNLLNLAPDIQEAILFLPTVERGREPVKEWQVRPIAAELQWRTQRRMWRDLNARDGAFVRSVRPPLFSPP